VRLAPGAELDAGGRTLTVEAARPFQDRWIVRFHDVATREAADALRSTELHGEPIDDPEALWVHDLVGASVVDAGGVDRGRVTAVLANPADDLLELEGGALVPVTFIVGWDDDRRVVIDPPDGLFDL
jgi:16S rRNA processing protein RimM